MRRIFHLAVHQYSDEVWVLVSEYDKFVDAWHLEQMAVERSDGTKAPAPGWSDGLPAGAYTDYSQAGAWAKRQPWTVLASQKSWEPDFDSDPDEDLELGEGRSPLTDKALDQAVDALAELVESRG